MSLTDIQKKIVESERRYFERKILKALGNVAAPFEIHFVDERIYNI